MGDRPLTKGIGPSVGELGDRRSGIGRPLGTMGLTRYWPIGTMGFTHNWLVGTIDDRPTDDSPSMAYR